MMGTHSLSALYPDPQRDASHYLSTFGVMTFTLCEQPPVVAGLIAGHCCTSHELLYHPACHRPGLLWLCG